MSSQSVILSPVLAPKFLSVASIVRYQTVLSATIKCLLMRTSYEHSPGRMPNKARSSHSISIRFIRQFIVHDPKSNNVQMINRKAIFQFGSCKWTAAECTVISRGVKEARFHTNSIVKPPLKRCTFGWIHNFFAVLYSLYAIQFPSLDASR